MTNQIAQRRLPKPGKQCKILVKKQTSTVSSRKNRRIKKDKPATTVNPETLQAQLMTDEQYLEQINKVQKSLPSFDIEKDCPPAVKKPKKKKFSLKSLFTKK